MSELEQWRKQRGLMQKEVAAAIGVSRATYQRLEGGRMNNPPLRYLVNCALALGCNWTDLIEPEWEEWAVFDKDKKTPPNPKTFWKA